MTENRYVEAGRHGVELAQLLKKALVEKGYELYVDTPTNQIFPILRSDARAARQGLRLSPTGSTSPDGRWVVRFCTSWATDPDAVAKLIDAL